jgi:hypothetical protein
MEALSGVINAHPYVSIIMTALVIEVVSKIKK